MGLNPALVLPHPCKITHPSRLWEQQSRKENLVTTKIDTTHREANTIHLCQPQTDTMINLKPHLMLSQIDPPSGEISQSFNGELDVDLGTVLSSLNLPNNQVITDSSDPNFNQVKKDASYLQAETPKQQEQLEVDPDLGRLRLRLQRVPPPQPQPVLHFVPRINFYRSNNLFSSVDPVDDSMVVPSILFWSTPKIGNRTFVSLSLDGDLIRYLRESQYDYNLVRFTAGVRQQLSSRMFGEVGWTNQMLFRTNGDRFLKENFLYVWLSRRDWLTKKLAFDSYLNLAIDFADPDDRSRFTNFLTLSFSYYLRPNFQVGLDYHFFLSDYTNVNRLDYFNRLMGRITYQINPHNQLNFQIGFSRGNSTQSNINFNDWLFSITYAVDFPIF